MNNSNDNIPNQLTLPFDAEIASRSAEVISFNDRKEAALAAQVLKKKSSELSESEILKRVLQHAERLTWYK